MAINVGIAGFVLRAANALQLPIGDLLYGDLQPFAEKTRFGQAFLVMTFGFGIVAALLMLSWVFDRVEPKWGALVLSLVLLSGLSLSSHQASRAQLEQGDRARRLAPPRRRVRVGRRRRHARVLRLARGAVASSAGVRRLLEDRRRARRRDGARGRIPRLRPASRRSRICGRRTTAASCSSRRRSSGSRSPGAASTTRSSGRGSRPARTRPSGRASIGESLVAVAVLLAVALLVNAAPPPVEPATSGVASALSSGSSGR